MVTAGTGSDLVPVVLYMVYMMYRIYTIYIMYMEYRTMEEKAMRIGAALIAAFLVLLIAGFVLIGVLCVISIQDETRQAEQIEQIIEYIESEG